MRLLTCYKSFRKAVLSLPWFVNLTVQFADCLNLFTSFLPEKTLFAGVCRRTDSGETSNFTLFPFFMCKSCMNSELKPKAIKVGVQWNAPVPHLINSTSDPSVFPNQWCEEVCECKALAPGHWVSLFSIIYVCFQAILFCFCWYSPTFKSWLISTEK